MRDRVGRLVVILAAFVLVGAMGVTANSTGRQADIVHDREGCNCHSPQPNSGTKLSVDGVPERYEPGTRYTIRLSSTTDVLPNPLGMQGGFLAWADNGSLAPADASSPWYRVGALNGSQPYVEHNVQGARDNRGQEWQFVWTAPRPGVGPVDLHVYANRVNGDANATPDDHWNRLVRAIQGPAETSSPAPTTNPAPTTDAPPAGFTASAGPPTSDAPPAARSSAPTPGAPLLALAAALAAGTVRNRRGGCRP